MFRSDVASEMKTMRWHSMAIMSNHASKTLDRMSIAVFEFCAVKARFEGRRARDEGEADMGL